MSPLHRRDPRAKLAAALVFLVCIATTSRHFATLAAAYFALLVLAVVWARLPLAGALARAAVVLPFSLAFAAVTWLAGDPGRAAHLLVKSYLSALTVLLLVATTPLPRILRGLEMFAVPRFLLMVTQFLYRYLFVLSEEAQHMRIAAAARGSASGPRGARARFRAAAAALAVLFARSYSRAGGIHQAMLARGFEGRFRLVTNLRFSPADAAFLVPAILVPVALSVALGVAAP